MVCCCRSVQGKAEDTVCLQEMSRRNSVGRPLQRGLAILFAFLAGLVYVSVTRISVRNSSGLCHLSEQSLLHIKI